jgi:SNF2 family DNA or RNA helicase
MLSDFEEMAGSFSADESWRKHIKKIDFSKKHDPKIPKHLASKLRPYQVEGYKWMSRLCSLGLGCCLADDMGLGKTLQTITLVLEQAVEGPCLVVAPKSVCYVWEEECKKFAPKLNIVRMIEDDKEAREQLIDSLKAMDVLVISYGILPNLEKPLIKKHWQVIILDEAQAIKNFNTKRFKIVTQLKGEKRVALSGTPVENHVSELWNLFYFLNPGFLGNKTTFHEQYIKPIEQTNDPLVKATLKRLVQPFILRRVKEKVLAELPAKTEQTIFIEPSSEEKHFYEALRQTSIQKINEVSLEDNQAKKRLRIFAEITKLKRACCDSSLIDSSIELPNSKLKVFDDLIRELKENNHKVLVFSQYVDYLNIIKSRVEALGFAYQYLDGSTSANERKKAIEKFQSGQSDLFLISLKAGGTGLTLTAANYVIHMDPWWNPAVEDQASARAHRLGQQNPVTVYRLVVKYSIEEKIMEMHKTKRELASSLLEGTDTAAHLTEEDLMKLVLS